MALGAVMAVSTFAASPALAHQAGDWLAKVGVTHIDPKSGNGKVLDTVGLDVGTSTRPSFSVT